MRRRPALLALLLAAERVRSNDRIRPQVQERVIRALERVRQRTDRDRND